MSKSNMFIWKVWLLDFWSAINLKIRLDKSSCSKSHRMLVPKNWFISQFGPEVILGNVGVIEISLIERA